MPGTSGIPGEDPSNALRQALSLLTTELGGSATSNKIAAPHVLPLLEWLLVEGRAFQNASPALVSSWGSRLTTLNNALASTSEHGKWIYFQLVHLTAVHSEGGCLLKTHAKQWFNALLAYFHKSHDTVFVRDVLYIAVDLFVRIKQHPELQKDASMTYLPKLIQLWLDLVKEDAELLTIVDWPQFASLFREYAFLSKSMGSRMIELFLCSVNQGRTSAFPGLMECLIWIEFHLKAKVSSTNGVPPFSVLNQICLAIQRELNTLLVCVEEEGRQGENGTAPTSANEWSFFPADASPTSTVLMDRLDCLIALLQTFFTIRRSCPGVIEVNAVLSIVCRVQNVSGACIPKSAGYRSEFQTLLLHLPKLKTSVNYMLVAFITVMRKYLVCHATELAHACIQSLEDSHSSQEQYRISVYALTEAVISAFGCLVFPETSHGPILIQILRDISVPSPQSGKDRTLSTDVAPSASSSSHNTSKKRRKYQSEKDDIVQQTVVPFQRCILSRASHLLRTLLNARIRVSRAVFVQIGQCLISSILFLAYYAHKKGLPAPVRTDVETGLFALMQCLAASVSSEDCPHVIMGPTIRLLKAFVTHSTPEMEMLCSSMLATLNSLLHPRLPPLIQQQVSLFSLNDHLKAAAQVPLPLALSTPLADSEKMAEEDVVDDMIVETDVLSAPPAVVELPPAPLVQMKIMSEPASRGNSGKTVVTQEPLLLPTAFMPKNASESPVLPKSSVTDVSDVDGISTQPSLHVAADEGSDDEEIPAIDLSDDDDE